MSALPLNLIKGTRSAAYERLENTEDIEEVEQHIQTIKSKVSWCFIAVEGHESTLSLRCFLLCLRHWSVYILKLFEFLCNISLSMSLKNYIL